MTWGGRAAEQHEQDQPSMYDPMLLVRGLSEIRIVEDPTTRNGVGYLMGDVLMLGIRPWTEIERAGYHARWIVNNGLSDVVDWLGEPRLPYRPSERSVMDFLRQGYEVEMPGFLGNQL